MIHDLSERGVGVRNLADPVKVDSSAADGSISQLAVVLLALFGQMERTYSVERAAHARSAALANGKRIGPPSVVDKEKLEYATYLRDKEGKSIAEIVKAGITRSSLYRYLPDRPLETLTVQAFNEDRTEQS